MMPATTYLHPVETQRNGRAQDAGSARAALDLQAVLLSHTRLADASAAWVHDIARHFGFDRVSLGLQVHGELRVMAVSTGLPAAHGTPAIDRLRLAMVEALDQRASVMCPEARAQAHPRIMLAHSRLLGGGGAGGGADAAAGAGAGSRAGAGAGTGTGMGMGAGAGAAGGAVASVPVVAEGRAQGALCVERSGRAISALELETLEHLACLAGPVLNLMQLNQRSLTERARDGLHLAFTRPEQRPALWGLAFGTLALAVLALLPAEWRIGGHARLEGAEQRVLVAPADGFLRRVHARPGEQVRAGQRLIELAEQDLLLEQQRWQSQLSQHENAYAAANARADRALQVIHQTRVAEAEAQLELVQSRLERGRIDAPFDGIVIQGDLTQQIGAPLSQGAELMTVAPANRFRVIVEVDERDIATVAIGQSGSLALSALPWNTLPIRITRITPVATPLEGRNSFEVEAELLAPGAELRPGLQGTAQILVGRQPLLASWSRRLVDASRLAWWEVWG